MARIFLSHSSIDNATAIALRDWLIAEGWDDLFLDLDPERGIGAGERWERALNEAAHRCEAVLFLVSTAWLNSAWCMREFRLANRLNKRMFGVLIEDLPIKALPVELTSTWQMVNLATGSDHVMIRVTMPESSAEEHVTCSKAGLSRLKTGLTKAGLDSRFFAWPPKHDPDRPPYRGLRPLEADDAGIFFGREAPIIEMLDRLRGLRDSAPPRFLAILGASGAGKSSFLRAGLIPRLVRDDRNFLVLPIIRPERAAISGEMGFLHSLEDAAKHAGLKPKRADIKKMIADGAGAVRSLLATLAEKATPPKLQDDTDAKAPTIILAIDQGEELFQAEGSEEAQALLTLLRDLAAAPSPDLIVLFTIRSDSYERLQTAAVLDGIRQQTMSLPPLPKGAYQTVIEGPANRMRDSRRSLKIEPQLTQALLAGIEAGGAKDALPLLAFTLERLYLEHGGDGDLKLADYEEIGGIAGSIEAAVERALRAADKDPAVPRERAMRLALMRRAFIPWLAGIDPETGSPRRAIARLSEIPEESRPLVQHLVDQHLLATDVSEKGEHTVEPAHEALLRQWGLLQGWLKEDFAQLSALEGVKRATRDWLANNKSPDWLGHAAGRLEDAETLNLRPDLAGKLEPVERDYLTACRAAETARKEKDLEEARELAEAQRKIAQEQQLLAEEQRRNAEESRKAAMRLRMVAVVAVVLALLSIATAIYGYIKAREAQEKTAEAVEKSEEAEREKQKALYNEGIALSGLSRIALAEGYPAMAVKLALAAWPRKGDEERPALLRTISALSEAFPQQNARLRLEGHEDSVLTVDYAPDGTRLVTASSDGTARLWDARTGLEIAVLRGHAKSVTSARFSPDGTRILTSSWDGTARLWDARTGAEIGILAVTPGAVLTAVLTATFSPDGSRLVTGSADGLALLWDAKTFTLIAGLKGNFGVVDMAAFSSDGRRVLTASSKFVRVWDGLTGAPISALDNLSDDVLSAALSPDGRAVVTAERGGIAQIWDASNGTKIMVLEGHQDEVHTAVFSPDGTRILTASSDKTARLWDTETGQTVAILSGHQSLLKLAIFSPDGRYVLTGSADKTARLWDSATGKLLAVLRGHRNWVISAAFSPDGKHVTTTSSQDDRVSHEGALVEIWDAQPKPDVLVLSGHTGEVIAADFSTDGERVVTASGDNTARLWNARTGAEIAVLDGHSKEVRSAVFSPDGSRILTASFDGFARLWDGKTGAPSFTLRGHSSGLTGASFSADGRRIVTTSADNTARVWDAETGSSLAELRGHEGTVNAAAFSADGRRIVTASADGTARVWDAETGASLAELTGHEDTVSSALFSPEGTLIVTAAADKTARLWNAKTGEPVVKLEGHTGWVYSPRFSRDGSLLLTASYDGTARVWDVRSGRTVLVLRGHTGNVWSAKFSPDFSRIVTASEARDDASIRIWDAETGAELLWLRGHRQGILSVHFSPDGAHVVSASWDTTARIWDISQLEKGDAFAIACARLGNDTDLADVRARYGLGEITPICGDHPPLPVDLSTLQ